jgi:hypothetical protein
LKKRTKKLLLPALPNAPAMASILGTARSKSLLLLFFRKEGLPYCAE